MRNPTVDDISKAQVLAGRKPMDLDPLQTQDREEQASNGTPRFKNKRHATGEQQFQMSQ